MHHKPLISHAAPFFIYLFFVNNNHYLLERAENISQPRFKAPKIRIVGVKLVWDRRFLFGYCKSNQDNVLSTGLPAGTIRGFTTLHNTINQNDLEELDLRVSACWVLLLDVNNPK